MSRPEPESITLVVDGVEIDAEQGAMLIDAAKGGDVEIPAFCYEPKLGDPVGACRMCLVEVEGIPKLQTACSTPVRDGMVVYTQTERVKEAQNAVVEFLLVNHPLDCPVCDKGGECPLQDISMGWGPGRSRVTDAKRHFEKPIPLSPLIRIDRERCIMCYRCVRFSQELSEDEQLQILDRGSRSYIGTHEDRPYVAPFHGNIIELCPVGALTSQAYRFRARPWDIEDAGSVCTLCPSQCNVKFTVRDDKVVRTLARDNDEVDDGWLCDKGRFAEGMFTSDERLTAPQIRAGGIADETSWEDALQRAADGLAAARGKVAAIVGGGASNEEGYLIQRLVRGPLASADVSAGGAEALSPELRRRLAAPELAVATSELDHAAAILVLGCDPMHEMPILELRIRKAVRRNGAQLLVASERPTALDGGTAVGTAGCLEARRYAPGGAAALLRELSDAVASGDTEDGFAAALAGEGPAVIVWGEGMLTSAGADATETAEALLELAGHLGLADADGAGLYEIPGAANGRGLREAGCAPTHGPGYGDAAQGRTADEIRAALESGELEGLILCDADPVRDFDDPEGWERALAAADFTLSISMFEHASARHADVLLPAESHAEKEGTVTHPDGRLQRVRPSVPRPGAIRPIWQALTELSAALGDETGAGVPSEVFSLLAGEIPAYNNVTVDKIGGLGISREETLAISTSAPTTSAPPPAPADSPSNEAAEGAAGGGPADAHVAGTTEAAPATQPPSRRRSDGPPPAAPTPLSPNEIHLATYRDIWASEVTEQSPPLRFLLPSQTLELSPDDAARLSVNHGQPVDVSAGERTIRAHVSVRERMLPGAGFLIAGLSEDPANRLGGARVATVTAAPERLEVEQRKPAYPAGEREAVGWR